MSVVKSIEYSEIKAHVGRTVFDLLNLRNVLVWKTVSSKKATNLKKKSRYFLKEFKSEMRFIFFSILFLFRNNNKKLCTGSFYFTIQLP